MPLPRKFLALGLTGALTAGLLGAGIAVAEGADGGLGARFAQQGGQHGKHVKAALGVKAIIEASGLDRAVFVDGFKAGKSVNTILVENGVDPAGVEADVLAALDVKLDELVANGRITQERADQAYAKAEEKLPALMDKVPDGKRPGAAGGSAQGARGQILEVAAAAIGIPVEDLRADLADGDTLADVATANGVDPQVVVDAIEAAMIARIEAALANGRIDQQTADQLTARAHGMAEKIVHSAHKNGRPGLAGNPQ